MAARKRVLKVFLCYAHVDKDAVLPLYEKLSHVGVDVWHDKNKLLAGQDWDREIRKAVRESDVVIVCHSKEFNKKGYRQKEVKLALEESDMHPQGEIFIIPARLEECDVLEDLQRWQFVDLFENDGFEKLLSALRMRAKEISVTFRSRRVKASKRKLSRPNSEKPIPEFVLTTWLSGHSLISNPFGNVSDKSNQFFPEGVTRPVQWEAFMDPVPLFAHCPTVEDAQTLAFLLRGECLPQKKNIQVGVNRRIFPIWIWQTAPIKAPLPTLAFSAARAWLDILHRNRNTLFELNMAEQNGVLELLFWSIRSKKMIMNLLQLNSAKEDQIALTMTKKISLLKNDVSEENVPQDAVLFSWLKIRPPDLDQTFVILPMDSLNSVLPAWWFEQFNSLIPAMSLNGIVIKAIGCRPSFESLSLTDIDLSWHDDWLKRSLDGQFDAVIDNEEKLMGKSIRFHELFGPGITEEETTQKLISASQNSLTRMLTIANRLLHKHCEKEFPDKYLSPEELEAILKTL